MPLTRWTIRTLALAMLIACARSTPSTPPTPDPQPAPQAEPAPEASPTVLERASGARVWVHDLGNVRIHTYLSPLDVFGNTSHIVESANAVVIVDPQLTITFATDARAYVDSLGKTIDRLVVSHAHPDHYLGIAAAWEDVTVHALASTIEEIRTTGEQVRQAREAMFPEGWLTDHVTAPTEVVSPGAVVIDGIDFVFEARAQAEHAEQLVVLLPAQSTTIAQDLVYTDVHPVITSRDAIDSWIGHLEALLEAGHTTVVLPGHGSPTDATGLTSMKRYLTTAKETLGTGADAATFKSTMMAAFPDRGGEGFVDFSVLFLFGG